MISRSQLILSISNSINFTERVETGEKGRGTQNPKPKTQNTKALGYAEQQNAGFLRRRWHTQCCITQKSSETATAYFSNFTTITFSPISPHQQKIERLWFCWCTAAATATATSTPAAEPQPSGLGICRP